MTPALSIKRGEVTAQELAALTASLAAIAEAVAAGAAGRVGGPTNSKARASQSGWARARSWRQPVDARW
ncbi:MAG: hypothetical protein LBR19_05480 [Bifidobacteriaceae bacterium]|jgi:hypothetical protein|nr:hypothetical protein [Bifidobacteriaceae bacterium]